MTVSRQIPFIGRGEVLDVLNGHLGAVKRQGFGKIIALRGRRQVGKSTVVERFVETSSVPYVFVTGVFQASSWKQLADATMAITDSKHPLPNAAVLAQSTASSWREWLARLAVAASAGPIVVVLDEFPWLVEGNPNLEGELQVQWDRVLQKLPVLMILIGSDVTMMDRLASHGRPLFGRVSPLVIPALNPAEVAEALSGWSAFDVFDAYLVTGGYPRLVLDLVGGRARSVAHYVKASLTDPYSPLITTARLSLDAEFPEPQFAYQVLSTIGGNDTAAPRFKDILGPIVDPDERKRAETATIRALRTLSETKGLVERELPAWALSSSKLRRYRVSDPYLRFWFRYIERNVDNVSRGRADLAIAAFDRDWATWRGQSIEPVVREALLRLAISDSRLTGVEAVQPWWVRDNSIEIDVVASTASATAVIGTIKWRAKGGVTARDMDQLRQQSKHVPRSDGVRLAAISPSGVAPTDADITFSAADLLDAWRKPG